MRAVSRIRGSYNRQYAIKRNACSSGVIFLRSLCCRFPRESVTPFSSIIGDSATFPNKTFSSAAVMQDASVKLRPNQGNTRVTHTPSPQQSKETLDGLCAQLHRRVTAFLEEKTEVDLLRRVQKQTKESLQVAEDALSRYTLDELCMSYNGGKDCLVLLVIYLAALHAHFASNERQASSLKSSDQLNRPSTTSSDTVGAFPSTIKSVYIRPEHPFEEVDDFVRTSAKEYGLDLATSAKPMKAAFGEYLEEHPEVKAIFVGTRRTDPHGGSLTHFDPTDRGWPAFMRVHPVIDWHYQEIWAFIRHLQIPYCSLYDKGYTSLGGTTDTHPNPKLRIPERSRTGETTGHMTFKPAFELQEDNEERLGRE